VGLSVVAETHLADKRAEVWSSAVARRMAFNHPGIKVEHLSNLSEEEADGARSVSAGRAGTAGC